MGQHRPNDGTASDPSVGNDVAWYYNGPMPSVSSPATCIPNPFKMLVVGTGSQYSKFQVIAPNGRIFVVSVGAPLVGDFPGNCLIQPFYNDINFINPSPQLGRLEMWAFSADNVTYPLKRADYTRSVNNFTGTVAIISEPYLSVSKDTIWRMVVDGRARGSLNLIGTPANVGIQFSQFDTWDYTSKITSSTPALNGGIIPLATGDVFEFDIPEGAYYMSIIDLSTGNIPTATSGSIRYLATFED
jgi:hypothetical protein